MGEKLASFFKGRIEGVRRSGVPLVEDVSRTMDLISRHNLDRNKSVKDALRKAAGSLKRSFRDRSPTKLLAASPRRRARRGTILDEWISPLLPPTLGKIPMLRPSPAK